MSTTHGDEKGLPAESLEHGGEGEGQPLLAEPKEYQREFDEHPAAVINLVAQLAQDWGGLWQPSSGQPSSGQSSGEKPSGELSGGGHASGALGGRLGIPVSAGLRKGWVAGPLEATPSQTADDSERTLLVFRAEVGEYRVDRAAVAVLIIAGLAGLAAMVAPFFPKLLGLVPLAMILGLAAWLMVIARLRNSGPDELLDQIEAGAEGASDRAPE